MDEQESAAWLGLVSVLELLPSALDAQLQRDAGITHFEFVVLSILRFAPDSTLRMKQLAAATNASLPRLSHVVSRLEARSLVERLPCPEDRRATNARLTSEGRRVLIHATPGHVDHVRNLVLDAVGPTDLPDLERITRAIAARLDPEGVYSAALAGTPMESRSGGAE